MNLKPYTRRLEECRKRWHRSTVQYVLAVVRIVRAARRAAKTERRWGQWIRDETHMNRTTVYRYLRVAEFLQANVDDRQQLIDLGIVKLYALSRLTREQARRVIKNGVAERLCEVSLLRMVRRIQPGIPVRATRPNLTKSVVAALGRLESSLRKWQHSDVSMPVALRARLQTRLNSMTRALGRIREASAAAM